MAGNPDRLDELKNMKLTVTPMGSQVLTHDPKLKTGDHVTWKGKEAVVRVAKMRGYIIDTEDQSDLFVYWRDLEDENESMGSTG